MATRKIQATKNYRMFKRSDENRILDLKAHKRLEQSMKKYGFLPCFPIVCQRVGKDLIVKEGQHRLAFAEALGLTVYWVEDDSNFDIAEINCTPKGWAPKDYALKFAANGNEVYQELLDFSEEHGVTIGLAAAMLGGTVCFNNVRDAFFSGAFKIKDRAWANAVAAIYVPCVALSKSARNARFLQACMWVCRVKEFEAKRLLQNAQRCREKFVQFSTKEAYLDMLEEVYNFGRKQLFGLKAAATMAMRERNACEVKRLERKQRLLRSA